MSKLGKIILDGNYSNPFVIIAEGKINAKALELIVTNDEYNSMKLKEEDIVKIKYRGKKLNERSVDLRRVHSVNNLQLREIGYMKEDSFCILLRKFNNYQVCQGANSPDFLSVKQEVQAELIKRLSK